MKKLLLAVAWIIAVNWDVHAQADSIKIKTDSSAIQPKNANPNREGKQDSINERKKMPPRKNTTLIYYNGKLLNEMRRTGRKPASCIS